MSTIQQYSNQYLITKEKVDTPIDNWKSINLNSATVFHAPNLNAFEKTENGHRIILLGFAIHVLHPDWDEQEIVNAFPIDEHQLLNYIDHLCGIHLIIVQSENQTFLYNDAAGVMKMFNLKEGNTITTIASDPKLIAEVKSPLKNDSSQAKEFYNSEFFQKNCIYLGSLTEYSNIEQILPNHRLELNSGAVQRYFPREKKATISVEEALNQVHTYFSNIINAAHRKYQIKCSMTAGWDSRMLVAITKEVHPDVDYYTFWLPYFNTKHEDVKIPSAIAKELNLNHNFIGKDIRLSSKDLQTLKKSFGLLKYENIDTYLGGFPHYINDQNVLLLGTVSEICKNYYDNVTITDGASFAKAAHFPVIPFTIDYFDKKLAELQKLETDFGYDLKDIAHWEQDITNFAAKRTLYLSSFVRAFSPFNVRITLQTILSTPREMRDKQQHEFYRLYLEKFYPELLKFPVNPSMKQQLIRLGKKIGVYNVYKKLSTQLRK